MNPIKFYTAGKTAALRVARSKLESWGFEICPAPADDVTHLLLPVPSFESPGILKGGVPLDEVLSRLPESVTIFGGGLPEMPQRCIDLLKDEFYLLENAAITAQCASQLIQKQRDKTITNENVLIIGWGRIGKALAPMLGSLGANVTVCVRREQSLREVQQAGYAAVLSHKLNPKTYSIIVNTAPAPILDAQDSQKDALLIDLASVPGIIGDNVLRARGLPGKDAPEASGTLIAKTVLRYALGKE